MTPWPQMFRAGVAAGLSPNTFWALSLREWRWLAAADESALSQAELSALRAAIVQEENRNGGT